MARLFCEHDGLEYEERVIRQASIYRQEGESILIVKGKLISGGWLCDRCNAPLGKGKPAYLATAFPRWITQQMADYDFIQERQYFAVGKAEVAVYGAEWPGGMPPALR